MGTDAQGESILKMEPGTNATEILQRMLSRKKVLVAQGGSFTVQAAHPCEGSITDENAAGGLQRDIAAMLGDEQLSQQEAELVSDIVQQVLAEHGQPLPANHQPAVGCAASSSNTVVSSNQQHISSSRQQTSSASSANCAGDEAIASVWEITAAEQALEQELQQLGMLRALHSAGPPPSAAAAVGTWSQQKRTSAASGGAATPADPYAASECGSRFTSCNGLSAPAGVAAAAAVGASSPDAPAAVAAAQALDSALEDPNASVEDIVGILNYVLDLSSGSSSSNAAAALNWSTQTHAGLQAVAAAAAVADSTRRGAAAAVGRSQGSSSSDGDRKETPAEMAARLLEQARAAQASHAAGTEAATGDKHPSATTAAAAGQCSAACAVSAEVRQAMSASMKAWNAEGGLMYINKGSAAAGSRSGAAAAAAASGWGNTVMPRSASPKATVAARGMGGFLNAGTYAGRAAARNCRSPHRVLQHEGEHEDAWMTPAEIEKAWRKGLRGGSRGGATGNAGGRQQQQGAAGSGGGAAAAANYAAILAGFDGMSGPQEWTGYDGLLGLQQQAQQQQLQGNKGGANAACASAVNSYKARDTPELDAKLRRLYERNVDWRQRCEMVYARQRRTEQQEELQGCTFHPQINKKSERIVQQNSMRYPIKPIRPVTPLAHSPEMQRQQRQRPASTGRIHHKQASAEQQQQQGGKMLQQQQQQALREQHAAALRAAAAAAAVLGEQAGRELMARMLAAAGTQQADDGFSFSPVKAGGSSGRKERVLSPPKAPAAAQRLYDDAFMKKERQAQIEAITKKTERKARSWSAPRNGMYRDVAPRVYNYLVDGVTSPKHTRQLQTGLDECTFHPQTNAGRSKFPDRSPDRSPDHSPDRSHAASSPDEAAAAAAAGNCSPMQESLAAAYQRAIRQQQQQDESSDFDPVLQNQQREQREYRSSTAAGSDVAEQQQQQDCDPDWQEFIERQGMFLLLKEAKRELAASELCKTKKLELSPGSKRILKDKQRMEQLQKSAGSLDTAYEQIKQRQQQQQFHVTAQVLPSSLYYPSDMQATLEAAAESASSPLHTCDNAAGNTSPVGSQCSAGSPYLSRVQQQLRSSTSSPAHSASSPSASPGSSGYYRGQLQASCGSGSSSSGAVDRGSAAAGKAASTAVGQTFTFKPAITRKAAALKPRSCGDMSEGDRLRREAKLEQLRIMGEARGLAGATFTPDMSPTRSRGASGCYDTIKPKISMRPEGLEAYMSSLEQKRREKEDKRKKLEQQRKEAELAECTFKPITTPLPAYLSAMAGVGYTARYIEERMADAMGQHQACLAYPAQCPHEKQA